MHYTKHLWALTDLRDEFHVGLTANDSQLVTEQVGNVQARTMGGHEATILSVNYSPSMPVNFLSLGWLYKRGYVLKETGTKMFKIYIEGGVFKVRTPVINNQVYATSTLTAQRRPRTDESEGVNTNGRREAAVVQVGTLSHFHKRFGHLNYDKIIKMAKKKESGIRLLDEERKYCVTCAEGKQTKNSLQKRDSDATSPIDQPECVICSDIKGPMSPPDHFANRYMVVFVDHCSNYTRVFLAKQKNFGAVKFQHFMAHFERAFNCRIQMLRTDGGKEYRATDLFCESTSIHRQRTEPNQSVTNGKAERMHRTLVDMAHSMLFNSTMPVPFWDEAVQYACYVHNRIPTNLNPGQKSPLEALTGKIPKIADIVAFGSKCTVAVENKKGQTWNPRAMKGYIIGLSEEVKGY
jgi:hypothetical protein